MTFAQLDQENSIPPLAPPSEDEFPLQHWYRSVYHVPIESLSAGDICKACRQGVHSAQIVPMAIRLLKRSILEGEMFDGELLSSLKSISEKFWVEHSDLVVDLTKVVMENITEVTGDLLDDANQLLRRLRSESREK